MAWYKVSIHQCYWKGFNSRTSGRAEVLWPKSTKSRLGCFRVSSKLFQSRIKVVSESRLGCFRVTSRLFQSRVLVVSESRLNGDFVLLGHSTKTVTSLYLCLGWAWINLVSYRSFLSSLELILDWKVFRTQLSGILVALWVANLLVPGSIPSRTLVAWLNILCHEVHLVQHFHSSSWSLAVP